jgi:hypothetical protein
MLVSRVGQQVGPCCRYRTCGRLGQVQVGGTVDGKVRWEGTMGRYDGKVRWEGTMRKNAGAFIW